MAQGIGYSLMVNIRSYIGCSLFDRISGIAHRYTETGMVEHGNIVASIPKRECFTQRNGIIGQYLIYACAFTVAFDVKVCKGWIPAAGGAVFENISHQDLFLLTAYINVDLKYLFLSNLMQISDWRRIETNHRCHIGYRLINVIDVNLGGCHKCTRKFIPVVQTLIDGIEVCQWNRIAENHTARMIDAPGSVEGNIAIKLQIAEVVDLIEWATGCNEYFNASAA